MKEAIAGKKKYYWMKKKSKNKQKSNLFVEINAIFSKKQSKKVKKHQKATKKVYFY